MGGGGARYLPGFEGGGVAVGGDPPRLRWEWAGPQALLEREAAAVAEAWPFWKGEPNACAPVSPPFLSAPAMGFVF